MNGNASRTVPVSGQWSEVERLAADFKVGDYPESSGDHRLDALRRHHRHIRGRLETNDASCFHGYSGANITGVLLDMRLEEIERRAQERKNELRFQKAIAS